MDIMMFNHVISEIYSTLVTEALTSLGRAITIYYTIIITKFTGLFTL